MDRATFQRLAEERLEDARVLRDASRFAAAYYVAGYAVECALKACIARQTAAESFPPKNADKLYTHHLESLIGLATLQPAFKAAREANTDLATNWSLVSDWKEDARYIAKAEPDARALIAAIEDANNGVLTWLRSHW